MGYDRLYEYVYDRFPEVSEADIAKYFRKNVPNWRKIPAKTQTTLVRDWSAFTRNKTTTKRARRDSKGRFSKK